MRAPATRIGVGIAVVVLLGVLAVAAILAARGGSEDGYTATVEANFVSSCVAGAEDLQYDAPQEFCDCTFAAIERNLDFETFRALDEQMAADPSAVPAEIDEIRIECYQSTQPSETSQP